MTAPILGPQSSTKVSETPKANQKRTPAVLARSPEQDVFVQNKASLTETLNKLGANEFATREKAMQGLINLSGNLNLDELKEFIQNLNDFKAKHSNDREIGFKINGVFSQIVKMQIEKRINPMYNRDRTISIQDLSAMTMPTDSIEGGNKLYQAQENAVAKLYEQFGDTVLDDLYALLKVSKDSKMNVEFAYKGIYTAIARLSKNEKILTELTETNSIKIKIALVSNENLNEELRNKLLQEKINGKELKWHIVKSNNPVPEKLLCKLFQDENVEFKRFLMLCYLRDKPRYIVEEFEECQKKQDLSPETIASIQDSLLKSNNILLLKCVSGTKFQTPNFLHKLAELNDKELNAWIVSHAERPESVDLIIRNELTRITGNENGDIFKLPQKLRESIVRNPNTSAQTLEKFANDPSDKVKEILVGQISKLSEKTIDAILRNENPPVEEPDPDENQYGRERYVPSPKKEIIWKHQLSEEQFNYVRDKHPELIPELLRHQKLSDSQFKEFMLSDNQEWRGAIAYNDNLTDEQAEHLFDYEKYVKSNVDDPFKRDALLISKELKPGFLRDDLVKVKTQDTLLIHMTFRTNLSREQIDRLVTSGNKRVEFYMARRDSLTSENIEHLIRVGDMHTKEIMVEHQKLTVEQLDQLISFNDESLNRKIIDKHGRALFRDQIDTLVEHALKLPNRFALELVCEHLNLSEENSMKIIDAAWGEPSIMAMVGFRTKHPSIVSILEGNPTESVRRALLFNSNLSTATFDRILASMTNANQGSSIPFYRGSFRQLQAMGISPKNFPE